MRVARSAPQLLERMVLVNPATSFRRSLGGLTSLVAATNLLSIFPERLYQVMRQSLQLAQAQCPLHVICAVCL